MSNGFGTGVLSIICQLIILLLTNHLAFVCLTEKNDDNDTVGWTWQGGLPGTMGGRLYGMCAHLFVRLRICRTTEH